MSTDTITLITAAKKEIAKILAKLEADTASVVDRLCVIDIDVTTMEDTRTQLIRRVMIELKRPPGTRWEQ